MMKVVIVGASHSGTTVAVDLKKLQPSFEIFLIDRQPVEEWGYVSNGINLFYQHHIKRLSDAAISSKRLKDSGVVLMPDRTVSKIDSDQKQVFIEDSLGKKSILSYDYLVIATGSTPQETIEMKRYKNLIHYKSYQESKDALEKIKKAKKIAIIGSSYVGLELADSLSKEDKEIIVIDTMKNILFRYFDPDVTDTIKKSLVQQGIRYYPQQYQIDFQEKEGLIKKIKLTDREVDVDLVVFPVSLQPNTELLEDIVELNEDNTVHVDTNIRTSCKNIYAVGDIVPLHDVQTHYQVYLPLVNQAVRLGRLVAMSIAGLSVNGNSHIKVSATHLFGYYLGSCGITEEEAPYLGRRVATYKMDLPFEKNLFGEDENDNCISIKLIYDCRTQIIIGIQLRSHSPIMETLNLGVLILRQQMTLVELACQDFCFSPEFTKPFHVYNEVAFRSLSQNVN